jgi:hypothetical protein
MMQWHKWVVLIACRQSFDLPTPHIMPPSRCYLVYATKVAATNLPLAIMAQTKLAISRANAMAATLVGRWANDLAIHGGGRYRGFLA